MIIKDLIRECKTYQQIVGLLWDCQTMMFESQLARLLKLSQRQTNRLTHDMAKVGLIKIVRQGRANVICLTRAAAQEHLQLAAAPSLPNIHSDNNLRASAYAAEYLINYERKFVLARNYVEVMTKKLEKALANKHKRLELTYNNDKIAWQAETKALNLHKSHLEIVKRTIKAIKTGLDVEVGNPLKHLTASMPKAEERLKSLVVKLVSKQDLRQNVSELVPQLAKTEQALEGFIDQLHKVITTLVLPPEPQLILSTLPSITFPRGAQGLWQPKVSPNTQGQTEAKVGLLENRTNLYVGLPVGEMSMSSIAGVGAVNNGVWPFVVLDNNQQPEWYKRLLLHIALRKTVKRTNQPTIYKAPDPIKFELLILCSSEARKQRVIEQIQTLFTDNIKAIKDKRDYTFAISGESCNWGLESCSIEVCPIESLFENAIVNLKTKPIFLPMAQTTTSPITIGS